METRLDMNCKVCNVEITIPASAPHKTFCSTKCRNSWHNARRKKGLIMLMEMEDENKGED